ncbi:MAG: DEAD/DEAH box helicase [Prevotella sp.]|nr:DEAD/DEAH box helicase [Prevotella sp.]
MGNIERILTKLHINELNDMQNDAFDAILHTDNDVIILSPTGSGKTLAYLLPVSQLADVQSDNVQVLVIVPGRELALQSDTVLKNMGSGLRSCGCYGGRPAMEEHKTLKQVKPQVIFGTPGRLNDHIDKENISPYGIRYVVIDEFDKCLEMGFHDEMARLMKKLPGVRRRILLSATDAEQIPNFVRLARAEKLDYLIEEEQVTERIRLYEVNTPSKDKLDTLNQLLRSFGDSSSIVFLNYRDSVERTADYLRRSGFSASHFHGGMEQKLREDALYKFSNGSSNIFVSTDLASRGLDIPDIDNIVHYHLPQSEDGYIHRVGRTARWESEGRAFFLLGPDEFIPEFVEGDVETFDIPDNLPQPAQPKMATIYIGKGKKDKISKGDIVGYLCKKGGLEPNEIGRIDVKDRYTYAAVMRQKVSQVLKMTRGEKIKGIKTIVEIVK